MPTPLNGSLLRGFAILNLISDQRCEITASTVMAELGLNAATAHRFLATLEAAGALASHRRGVYCLGYRMVDLGRIAERTNPLAGVVQPAINAVAADLNESVMAARLSADGVVCVATASADRPVSVSIRVGSVLDPHATAHGKLWLAAMSKPELDRYLARVERRKFNDATLVAPEDIKAELDRVRAAGYATNLGEREPDIGAVAAPIRSAAGGLLLTLSVYAIRSRLDDALIERARTRLLAAAEQIREALYGRGAPKTGTTTAPRPRRAPSAKPVRAVSPSEQ